ncbi:sugar ABC transporter permease [Cuneatibacter sp. NSJ-177]|jgi:multiple sugar transport system permease protein|uniref:carbohydrate ABC transporter permease n=1 Tax=Cuneatibacter sp. NSJ-177 TaxID=2931401 RepID=UPI001FD49440|nr:sugar ABC transporter permease [Cuneatibacter sp. NSJ-177]MCJ7835569.1 sugar ABC transporter permease [Cuneatibacter sp. NSJ-177]
MKRFRIRRGQRAGILFVLPSLLGVAWFLLLPFLDVVARSFLGAVNGEWVGISNYQTIFSNEAFRLAAGNTVKFAVVCIPLLIVISLLISVGLTHFGRKLGFLKSAFLLPMAIPVASVALIWRLLFHSQGIVNGLMEQLGGNPVDWMNSPAAFWVLVLTYLWKNVGYDVILWMAGLSAIPYSIYEAAEVDGAGSWKCFTKITLPNLKPTLYTITVLSFLNSFKVFREAYLVGGAYPHDSMYLMQHLFNNWYRDLSMDKMAAAAVVVAVVIFLVMLCFQRIWARED